MRIKKGILSMRKVKEILRLHANDLSQHQIARSLNISVGAVNKYLKLFIELGVSWPLPEGTTEEKLKALLKPCRKACHSFTPVDYQWISEELRNKGVTLQLLHEEYCQQHPDKHYSYRQFCSLYREWRRDKNLSLRQIHKGGDKMFTDYAGHTIPIVMNRSTGEKKSAEIFVAALGASNLMYSEASWTQNLEDWISAHVRAFEYFEGVPNLVVPDNLKSGVSVACRYDPDINPSYAEMIDYYGTAVLPARPYKPKDKAKVEGAVLVVERWILARLRHETFYCLEDVNVKIKELLERANNKPFKKIEGSRRSLFEQIDKPALRPLPAKPYVYARFHHRKVTPDYHIEHERHFYSVHHSYVGKEVDIRVTERTIEILHNGSRISLHQRQRSQGQTTLPSHMPKNHLRHVEWTVERALAWSKEIGFHTKLFVDKLIAKKKHPDQITRLCLGCKKLERHYGQKRLEDACKRAIHYEAFSYKNVASILEKGLDREDLTQKKSTTDVPHENIRGAAYYH